MGKKTSTKKIKKRLKGYQKVIEEHREKIEKSGNSKAISHWEKEIEAAEETIEKLKGRLKQRKKRSK